MLLLSSSCQPSISRINRKGDSGSPCLNPFSYVKPPTGSRFTRTENLTVLYRMQSISTSGNLSIIYYGIFYHPHRGGPTYVGEGACADVHPLTLKNLCIYALTNKYI